MTDSLSLHSGDYVERYNRKPLDRVRNLVSMMDISSDTRLADFACGNGMLLHALGDREGTYEGVDFSADFIDSANAWAEREGRKNYRFHCADVVDFCGEHQKQFDVACTLDFSEHVSDAEAVPIYAAIRSALADGGKLYLHTPNAAFFLEQAKDKGIIAQFPEHIAVRDAKDTVAMLVAAGFPEAGITVRYIAHYNVLRFLHPLSHLPFLGKWLQARLLIEAKV
ncbi:class I SAM-dependent methyltransferase [Aurantiacibacter sp. D1-12]|uniref:class I SAM-dependent methyltransferase n=1 Tax=Aurantiacibacter sp. D1-12 TaxID=2993658 RepID=UPI00237D2EEC|nr:class I SAM-dependent methyltransferase [Aurantiacibacter sp. D1-12]MDE1466337.1 class I SAM-dependent methyltransferase [Aurantiacibacter sp. D1-12]